MAKKTFSPATKRIITLQIISCVVLIALTAILVLFLTQSANTKARAVALTPNPRAYALYGDKRHLTLLSDGERLAELGVPEALLARVGAVSEPVAAAMAQGARRQGRMTWALAVSGIAGPGGGSRSKPVGTVCFAWAGPDQTLQVSTQHFPGNREEVRAHTVAHALTVLLQHLDRPLAA